MPRSLGHFRWGAPGAWVLLGRLGLSAPAGTIALWLFDEPAGSPPGTVLHDAGIGAHSLILGGGGALVPGRSGGALRPVISTPNAALAANSAARTTRDEAGRQQIPWRNFADSALNLDSGDWTVEGWFFLEAAAAPEGVVFELGCGLRGCDDLVTRIGVLPRAEGFVLSGLAPVPPSPVPVAARRVEFPNPGGPPADAALLFTATLVGERPLPRATWFHAAIVHAASGVLRLVVDGTVCAVATADLLALPRSDEAYISVGSDGQGHRPFPGMIDELRISRPSRDGPADEARPARPLVK